MKRNIPHVPERPFGVIFTDLDGTLLDHVSYRPSAEASRLLDRLLQRDIAVIPATSKTAAEVRPLLADLALSPLAIVEGGAVVLDADDRERLIGSPRRELVAVLERLKSAGFPLRGMSEMSSAEVVDLTGLEPNAAALAMTRSASEPFVTLRDLAPEEEARMVETASANGAELARGGRFWHIHTIGVDKGAAVRGILGEFFSDKRCRSAAFGDAWNDLPMLAEVEQGFLLGNAVEQWRVPTGVIRVSSTGPGGFVEAVGRLLEIWNAPQQE